VRLGERRGKGKGGGEGAKLGSSEKDRGVRGGGWKWSGRVRGKEIKDGGGKIREGSAKIVGKAGERGGMVGGGGGGDGADLKAIP